MYRLLHTFLLFIFFASSTPLLAKDPSFTLDIPMRDGMLLSTDFYLPTHAEKEERFPCILIRNPTGRKAEPWISYSALADAGYVVAFQDTRSALDAQGCHVPYWSEGWGEQQDGYDTVEWLANSQYCNGKVATLGQSAAGITQLLLAPTKPPSLCCQYIGTATASLYQHAIYPGGLYQKNLVDNWLKLYAPHPTVHLTVSSQPNYNDFWNHFDCTVFSNGIETPAILYTGWYDTFLEGTLSAFETRQSDTKSLSNGTQKLLIGPWTHHWPAATGLGSQAILPPIAQQPPQDFSPLRWFDYHLKGIENGVEQIPLVTYYLMGPFDGSESGGNRWKTSTTWPLPHTPKPLFLTLSHSLSFQPSLSASEATLSFNDDPASPVPTLGGNHLFIESGPLDQSSIIDSPHVLTFTTAPLDTELTLTGKVLAELNVTCDQPNGALVLRLCDVYPDGKSLLILEGGKQVGPSTKEPTPVKIELGSTAMVIAKGHALRLIITGSSVPRFAPPNYGATANKKGLAIPHIAKFTVFVNEHSRLILPVSSQ